MKKDILKNTIIVFLLILVVFLLTFIIWNNFILKNEDNDFNENNSSSDIIAGIEEFPTENSDDVLFYGELFSDLLNDEARKKVDIWKDFGTVTLNINDIPVTYKCNFEEYQDNSGISRCVTVDINFGKHNLSINNSGLGCSSSDKVIYTYDYLIHQVISGCCDNGSIYIYNKNHELLTTIDNVNGYYYSNGETIFNSFRLIDDVLYFITADWSSSSEGCVADILYLSYIDLNDARYKVHYIEKIK